jgi:hypothetical protein
MGIFPTSAYRLGRKKPTLAESLYSPLTEKLLFRLRSFFYSVFSYAHNNIVFSFFLAFNSVAASIAVERQQCIFDEINLLKKTAFSISEFRSRVVEILKADWRSIDYASFAFLSFALFSLTDCQS